MLTPCSYTTTMKITGRNGLTLTMRVQNALWLFHHNVHVLLMASLKQFVSQHFQLKMGKEMNSCRGISIPYWVPLQHGPIKWNIHGLQIFSLLLYLGHWFFVNKLYFLNYCIFSIRLWIDWVWFRCELGFVWFLNCVNRPLTVWCDHFPYWI